MVTVKQIEALDLYPLYVFEKGYCDKLYRKDDIILRTRYLITKNTCTCMSYMKGHFCKHLKMKQGEWTWLAGVAGSDAVYHLNKILVSLDLSEMDAEPLQHVYAITLGCVLDVEKVVISRNKYALVFQRRSEATFFEHPQFST